MKTCHIPKKKILAQNQVWKKKIATCFSFIYNLLFLDQRFSLLYTTKLVA